LEYVVVSTLASIALPGHCDHCDVSGLGSEYELIARPLTVVCIEQTPDGSDADRSAGKVPLTQADWW